MERDKASKDDCLRIPIYSINKTMGPDGLVPMLLVFVVLPSSARFNTSSPKLVRQSIIEEVKKMVVAEQAEKCISFAISIHLAQRPRNIRNAFQIPMKEINYFLSHKIKEMGGTIQIHFYRKGTSGFNWTRVEKYSDPPVPNPGRTPTAKERRVPHEKKKTKIWKQPHRLKKLESHLTSQALYHTWKKHLEWRLIMKKGLPKERAFKSSRKNEWNGLKNDGLFTPVQASGIPTSSQLFGSRFVNELKKVDDRLKKTLRLIAQNCSYDDATSRPKKEPRVKRFSQPFVISLAASLPLLHIHPYTRNITQEYAQLHIEL